MNLWKSKTVWTGISGIALAIGGYMSGEVTLAQAVGGGVILLTQIFQRFATEKAIS